MNTCGTCKYFGNPVEDIDVAYVPTGYHICMWIEQKGHPMEPDCVAMVTDASDYYAALCVKEEFGCNQWAAP